MLTKISIIVPAFNEEDVLEKFLENLQRVLSKSTDTYEIIVVDDGSSDKTFSIISNIPNIKTIRHPYNKGNGAAVKTGIMNAKGENVVVIDADGQHDPCYILEMLKLMDEYDLVVGARDSFGVGVRGFGNVLVSKIASYISGLRIPDLTSGLRMFKRDKVLEFLHLFPNGFSLPSTSTLAFAVSGYNVKFMSIKAIDRQGGESSISVFKDGMKFVVLIFRVISLFKPLKIFVPTGLVFIVLSLLWAVRTIFHSYELTPTVAMLFLGAIIILLFGLIADQMAESRFMMGKIFKSITKEQDKGND